MGPKKFQPAYSPERLQELGATIKAWYAGLPKPKIPNALKITGVSNRTVFLYFRAAERGSGPQPLVMQRLYEATGNPVFLLNEQEKEAFRVRGFVVPDEAFPGQNDPAEPPAAKDKGRHQLSMPFEKDRVAAMVRVIAAWFDSLPSPKRDHVQNLLGVDGTTVYRWIKGKTSPSLDSVYRLWKALEQPVFLLRENELSIAKALGYAPAEDYPTLESFSGQSRSESPTSAPLKTAFRIEADLVSAEVAFGKKASKLLVGVLTSVSVINDLLQESGLPGAPESIRHKVAEAVIKIVTTFNLTIDDFRKKTPEGGDDAETRKKMEIVYGLFRQPGKED